MNSEINASYQHINASELAADLAALRAARPLVLNLTNYVVMNTTANALLALGGSPVMAHAPEEQAEMAGYAGAVVLNIGTLDANWQQYFSASLAAAQAAGKPAVLDPVGAGASRIRTQTALDLLTQGGIKLIRGNASEVMALAGAAGTTKGVDATQSSTSALDAASALAGAFDCVVCVSGQTDYVVSADKPTYSISGGHSMMPLVTGLGCTSSALCGAFLSIQPDVAKAAAHAMAVMALAGERAAARAAGPGSLQLRFYDALYNLDEASILARFGAVAQTQLA